jgi:exosortase
MDNVKKEVKVTQVKLKYIILYLLFIGTIFSSVRILVLQHNMLIPTISLLLISAWCCFASLFKNKLEPHNFKNIEKWVLLYSGILVLFFSILYSYQSSWIIYLSIYFCISSLISYIAGRVIFVKTAVPIAVLVIILPLYQHIIYWISLPIRLICTNLTVAILSVLGMSITSESTVISVGSGKVAVTSACSGIVLLEMMVWIGWIIVLLLYDTYWKRVLHFSLTIPIVLLTNTIRLCLLVLLFSIYGEAVIISPVHIWAGYIMVIIAAGIFFNCKFFFKD